jgi:hypothetical protein
MALTLKSTMTAKEAGIHRKGNQGLAIDGFINPTSTAEFHAGDAVVLNGNEGGSLLFEKSTATTDRVSGIILYNAIKGYDVESLANRRLLLAKTGYIVSMRASEAITINSYVTVEEIDGLSKIKTADTGDTVIGIALEAATDADQLIEVYIDIR